MTADAFEQAVSSAQSTLSLLDHAHLPSWTGAAADAYRAYVLRIKAVVETYVSLLTRAASHLSAAEPLVVRANLLAESAADECNRARDRRRALMAQIPSDIEPAQRDRVVAGIERVTDAIMANGMDLGRNCISTLLTTFDDLERALGSIDAELADLTLPQPPDVGPPTLYALVRRLQEAVGDTRTARLLLSLINGLAPLSSVFIQALLAKDAHGNYRLSAEERQFILSHLSEAELNSLMKLPNDQLEDLIRHSTPETVDLLADADDSGRIRPEWADVGPHAQNWELRPVADPPPSGRTLLAQGGLGDCATLASLGAIEAAHPGLLASNITANADSGTYTVRLYDKDGKPFTVTVDSSVPTGYAQGQGPMNVYQIYEKAIAAASARGLLDVNDERGGYNDINGAWPENVAPHITGHPSTASTMADAGDLSHLNDRIQGGEAVNATTRFSNDPNDPIVNKYYGGASPILATGHVYYVTSVDSDGTVHLSNPWGSPSYDVTMPMADFRHAFGNISYTPTR